MEETLSLPVNRSFDKRAVGTKSGHEPDNVCICSSAAGDLSKERAFHYPPPRQWLEPGWEHHSLELVIGSDDEPTALQVRLTS